MMKVLYVSGYSDDNLVRRMVLEEGAPILEKPFTGDEQLTTLVRRCAK